MIPDNVESGVAALLRQKQFVVTTEMAPPKSADVGPILKKAAAFKGVADACNVTDNQLGIARMSALAVATLLVREGVEPILQITCRDMNRLALQSHLLGAWALGIHNVMCLSGDHPKFGNHPEAKPVYDLNIMDLLRLVRKFRDEGKFLNGEEIRQNKTSPVVAPRFFIGAAANPFNVKPKAAVVRLIEKINAGADFFQTQPVFDGEVFEAWMDAIRQEGLHERAVFLIGAMPVRSSQALRYIKEKVPGSAIPDALIQRMEKANDGEEAGIDICCETAQRIKKTPGVGGIHLMSVGWESALVKVVERAGLRRAPVLP